MARRLGRPAGRIVAHVPEPGAEGRFGFFATVDDPDVVAALVDAASAWLREQGCTTMTGPLSFEPEDEPGLLADRFDRPGTTGRPWHPPWARPLLRSEEHTSELQSLMRISYAVFCLKKKKQNTAAHEQQH